MEQAKTDKLFSYMMENIKPFYSENGRFFHTLEHLTLGFQEIGEYTDWYIENVSKDENDTGVTLEQVASWFYHDVVYNPVESSNNEKKSAEFAEKSLSKFKTIAVNLEVVKKIILDTKDHKPSIHESKLILDIDMSSLGYEYDKFIHYRKLAMMEYATYYSEELLINGTIQFIEKCQKEKRLYNLDYFFNKYEFQARENLNKYLDELLKKKG